MNDQTQGFADFLYNGPQDGREEKVELRASAITEADRQWLLSQRPSLHVEPTEGWVMPEAGGMGAADGLGR